MGLRVRLKASFDTRGFPPQARVVLEALKRYGMIVADNGSNWYISRRARPALVERRPAHARPASRARDFEVVDTSSLPRRSAADRTGLGRYDQSCPTASTSAATTRPTG